jgi:hypothetical protein
MTDYLYLLNTKLAKEIPAMDADELWAFLLGRLDQVKAVGDNYKFESWLFICLDMGFDLFQLRFSESVADECYRNDLNYTLILDFALEGEKIQLDYYGISGFYDDPDSCNPPTSDDLMPELDEDSDDLHHKKDFYILNAGHLDKIIKALEDHADNLTENTPADIETIKQMRDKCAADENYKVAYVYYEW